MSQLEDFYGFRLGVATEINASDFESAAKTLALAIQKLRRETGRDYHGYVSMCQFLLKRNTIHSVGPLSRRLEKLTLSWTVNEDEQRKGTLFFLNDQLPENDVLIDTPLSHQFGKYELTCTVDGRYVESHDTFNVLIAAAIHSSVKRDRRKVKLLGVAHPTSHFAGKIINYNGHKKSKVDYYLTRNVQLLLTLP